MNNSQKILVFIALAGLSIFMQGSNRRTAKRSSNAKNLESLFFPKERNINIDLLHLFSLIQHVIDGYILPSTLANIFLNSPTLLEQINNQNIDGQTTLHFAITRYLRAQANNDLDRSRRSLDAIRVLLAAGADANIADNDGNTARNLAPDLIQALILEQQAEELAAAGL